MKNDSINKKYNTNTLGSNKTAAWADVMKVEPSTNISIPSVEAVIEAKNWVDSNEK